MMDSCSICRHSPGNRECSQIRSLGRREKCGPAGAGRARRAPPQLEAGVPEALGERDPLGAADGTGESQARVELNPNHLGSIREECGAEQSGNCASCCDKGRSRGLCGF